MSFFFLLPNILLSGFMFPFEAMPQPAQILRQALPLTHFLRIVRGIDPQGQRLRRPRRRAGLARRILLALLVLLASLRFSKKLG